MKKYIIIALSICIIFTLCGCDIIAEIIDDNAIIGQNGEKLDIETLQENAKNNIQKHLEIKYPEKQFEIHNFTLSSRVDTIYKTTIVDESGYKYIIKTDGALSDEDGVASTIDNIEHEKVEIIIREKLKNIFNTQDLTDINFGDYDFAYYFCCHDLVDNLTNDEILNLYTSYVETHEKTGPSITGGMAIYYTEIELGPTLVNLNTPAFIYTYVDEEINFNNISDEDNKLLSKFNVVFTKFSNEDYHGEYKKSYIYLARYNYENGNLNYDKYINECHVYNSETNKMELYEIPTTQTNY